MSLANVTVYDNISITIYPPMRERLWELVEVYNPKSAAWPPAMRFVASEVSVPVSAARLRALSFLSGQPFRPSTPRALAEEVLQIH